MNEHAAASGSKRSLFGRLVRFFLKALGAFLALIVLAIIAFNIYLSTRPAPTTIRPAGTITLPAPFHFVRALSDYMTIIPPPPYPLHTPSPLHAQIATTPTNTHRP